MQVVIISIIQINMKKLKIAYLDKSQTFDIPEANIS